MTKYTHTPKGFSYAIYNVLIKAEEEEKLASRIPYILPEEI